MPLQGKESVIASIDALVVRKNNKLKNVFFQGLQNIAIGTPVDEGRARNSWFLGIGNIRTGTRSANKNGTGSLSDLGKIPKSVLGKKLYYTNNMPYINKLEYGGYPNPSDKRPSKVVGGFSDQKPKGWVRTELKQMRKRIRAIK